MAEEKQYELGVMKPRPQVVALANFRIAVMPDTKFDEQWSLVRLRSRLFA